jgi:hypothetical protein
MFMIYPYDSHQKSAANTVFANREGTLMADRNSIETKLAEAVHAAEYAAAQAISAPAGPGRIERILKADTDLIEAQKNYGECLRQQ